MLNRLKEKWQVNWWQFTLIFSTFAVGGSFCGYIGRKLLAFSSLEKGVLYFIVYLILVTALWPLCVLLVSIPFGQFPFFRRYLTRIWHKMAKNK